MAEPNPDDGLMADITKEYREHRPLFLQKAKAFTKQHASAKVQMAQSSTAKEVITKVSTDASAAGDEDESSSEDYDSDAEKENTEVGMPAKKKAKLVSPAGAVTTAVSAPS